MKNVGIDLIEIKRMPIKPEFINRYLSPDEIKEFEIITNKSKQIKFLAKHWALKEAIYKSLPQEHLVFNKINITKNTFGQPEVKIKNYNIKLSISYNKVNVIAIAIVFD